MTAKRTTRKKTSIDDMSIETEKTYPVPINNTPDMLLAKAIEKGVDVEQLSKLMELQEKWFARRAREEYSRAFSKFQSMAPDLQKNKQVSYDHKNGPGKTEYKYQELGDIAKHIREALAECGLSYKWEQTEDKQTKEITVTCIVEHVGGHVERGMPLSGQYDNSGNKNMIQQKASTITYLRRYTLTGILGLSSTDVDNDGKGGSKGDDIPYQMLPNMTDDQLQSAMKGIMGGTMTIGTLTEVMAVSDNQMKALRKAQDEYMSKMPKPN